MSTGHTPGPWEARTDEAWPFGMSIVGADGSEVFYIRRIAYASNQKTIEDVRGAVGFDNGVQPEIIGMLAKQEADVALAAAAPELLTECEASAVALEEAANILAGHGLNGCAEIMRNHAQKARAAIAKARGEQP